MAKIQLRGNCQVCGRQHATTRGSIAAHGYTIKNGWFQGVCQGERQRSMQEDRSVTDRIVAQIRKDCVALRQKAADIEAGGITPPPVPSTRPKAPPTPFAELNEWAKKDAIKSFAWNTRRHAEVGEAFAKQLEELADRVHGTPLLEVPVEEVPEPIRCGDKRFSGKYVLEVTEVRGPRVYWKAADESGRTFKGWTGSAAFRRYAAV